MEDKKFDFEAFKKEALQKLKDGKGLVGGEGAFTPLIKSFVRLLRLEKYFRSVKFVLRLVCTSILPKKNKN